MSKYIMIADSGYAALVNGSGDTLKDLQTLVDGMVDVVAADPEALSISGVDAWVNDEGLYRADFGINLVASFITGRQLVGPVVLVRRRGPDTIGFTDAQIKKIINEHMMIDTNDGAGWSVAEAAYFFGPSKVSP